MNIVLIGKPGSGKGTLAKQLLKDFKYIHLEAGKILRAEKDSGSELGREIQSIIDKGNLVSDETINDLIHAEFSKPTPIGTHFIMDGYPRTTKQAIALDQMINIQVVINLDVSDEIVTKRIIERGKTSGRADDQDKDIIAKRLENFYSETEQVIEYYSHYNKVYNVDASKSIIKVYNEIKKILKDSDIYG